MRKICTKCQVQLNMEEMKFAEEVVREFLVFRGFSNTLQAFEKELATDLGKGFQVDRILDLIFSVYVPNFEAEKLVDLLVFFKNCFSYYDSDFFAVISKFEQSILRYYVVNALKCGRKDKVLEFFGAFGNDLLRRDDSWGSWFAIPYLRHPHLDPQFRMHFSEEWFRTLHLSLRNFFSEVLNGTRTPALLKISFEREAVSQLKKEIKQLNLKLSQAQKLLQKKESLSVMKSGAEVVTLSPGMSSEACLRSPKQPAGRELNEDSNNISGDESCVSNAGRINIQEERSSCSRQVSVHGFATIQPSEEDYIEVEPVSQDSFLGHTGPITCGRFSASGDNIASASTDGTVRIWTHDSSVSATRNATIYCGAEVSSLEWECKSDRLLLIGTSDGSIKAWNADAKRVVCDLHSMNGYPSILDIKCSPVEPIFVSAAASKRKGEDYFSNLGSALLTVWNMRIWKAVTVLPLGEDPPAITSLSFNHNGKLLAAAATDGLIHMFDMSAGQQVTGWPAHDSAISSICFGSDETSIFSLGADGNVLEWSLHNQGKILWSQNCNRFRDPENSSKWRHEMGLDGDGKRLLVTSDLLTAPIYHTVRDGIRSLRTRPHGGCITTVDWHPTLPVFLTGSSDHSVMVTSIL